MSQLGFMVVAVGCEAYVPAIFHMITHACFKALLFLGAGSVIHGLDGEQDMRRMGALRKLMPITAITMIIGALAISGIPPFAGFWSKDEVLINAWDKSPLLWVVMSVAAVLTAYYMSRLVFMTFFGEARWDDGTRRPRARAPARVAPADDRAADPARDRVGDHRRDRPAVRPDEVPRGLPRPGVRRDRA